jgi:hypothetical protein
MYFMLLCSPLLLLAVVTRAATGASITLQEMLYDDLMLKRVHGQTDTAFNVQARLKSAGGHLPDDNCYPPSFYLAKKAVGAANWRDFEVHLCADPDCLGWVYPPMHPDEFNTAGSAPAEQQQAGIHYCGHPECSQPRFRLQRRGARESWVPRWMCIDFKLERVRHGSVGVQSRDAVACALQQRC